MLVEPVRLVVTALYEALEDALQLVHLYAERGSPKFEWAALRWLERYLVTPSRQ